MQRRLRHLFKSCGNKKRYPNRRAAGAAAFWNEQTYGKRFRVYKCDFGNHYHLTTRRRK